MVSPTGFPQCGQASVAGVASGLIASASLTGRRLASTLASERDLKNDEGVKFGLFVDPDTTRYSGLRLRRLKQAIKDPKILDGLVEELEVTGATGSNKMPAIERRIEELRATKSSLWYEVAAPEVLAASIFRAKKLQGPSVDDLFKRVARVQELAAPLATWLDLAGLTAHPGSAPGLGRANLIGYRGRSMIGGGHVVGIEATNDVTELGRASTSRGGSAIT